MSVCEPPTHWYLIMSDRIHTTIYLVAVEKEDGRKFVGKDGDYYNRLEDIFIHRNKKGAKKMANTMTTINDCEHKVVELEIHENRSESQIRRDISKGKL